MRRLFKAVAVLALLAGCRRQDTRSSTEGGPPAFSGRFEQVISLVRAVPPCDSVIGMSYGQTFPVPLDEEKGTRVRVYFYPILGKGGQANQVYSPAAQAIVEIERGAAVVCAELPGEPKKVGDIPAPDPKRGDLAGPLRRKQQELYRRTEAVIPAYYARKSREATAADKALAAAFLEGFSAVVNP